MPVRGFQVHAGGILRASRGIRSASGEDSSARGGILSANGEL